MGLVLRLRHIVLRGVITIINTINKMDDCTEKMRQLSVEDIDNPTRRSLHNQLETTLAYFERTEGIQCKQQACIIFTMQLLCGTLSNTNPDKREWCKPVVELCIYLCQITWLYDTTYDRLQQTDPITFCCLTDLFDDATDKWTEHAKNILSPPQDKMLERHEQTTLLDSQVHTLLKHTKAGWLQTAIKYIYTTLFELTTTGLCCLDEKLLESQSKLLADEKCDESITVLKILKKHSGHNVGGYEYGYDDTLIKRLLDVQTTELREIIATATEDDKATRNQTWPTRRPKNTEEKEDQQEVHNLTIRVGLELSPPADRRGRGQKPLQTP